MNARLLDVLHFACICNVITTLSHQDSLNLGLLIEIFSLCCRLFDTSGWRWRSVFELDDMCPMKSAKIFILVRKIKLHSVQYTWLYFAFSTYLESCPWLEIDLRALVAVAMRTAFHLGICYWIATTGFSFTGHNCKEFVSKPIIVCPNCKEICN